MNYALARVSKDSGSTKIAILFMMGLLGGEAHMQLAGYKQKEVHRFAGVVYLALALLLFTAPANALSEKKELELGKQLHAQVIASSGIYPDPSLQQYVNDIGQKLAAVADRNHLEFHFFVLDDDVVNAMALPGGYIYVTRGLIAHLNSEAQLAAVIGHEIGHVDGKHASERDRSQKFSKLLTTLTAVGTGSMVASQGADMLGTAAVSGYGRGQELEADALGAKFLAKTGYPTHAVVEGVEILKRREQFEIERARVEDREPKLGKGLFATHPDNDKRFEEAVESANEYITDAGSYDENTEEFLDRLNGLSWGPKRAAGVIRNNWFYNSSFGIKMKFPDGWRVDGKPGTLQAISPENDAVLQVFGVVPGRTMTLVQALQRKLGVGEIREYTELTISGMEAILVVGERWGQSPFGPRPVRAAVVKDNRKRQAFIFAGTGRHDLSKIASDEDFISTIFSFDHMKQTEMQLGLPPTIKVVRAEEGTTFAELAKISSVPAYAEQQLRLINGMYPRGEPVPGQLIKVID
jgi:predicted Zn-dependent protease